MMKIREILRLVYWLIFQGGIWGIWHKIEEIEIRSSKQKANVSILQTRIIILEKQVQKLMDTEVLPHAPKAEEFLQDSP